MFQPPTAQKKRLSKYKHRSRAIDVKGREIAVQIEMSPNVTTSLDLVRRTVVVFEEEEECDCVWPRRRRGM